MKLILLFIFAIQLVGCRNMTVLKAENVQMDSVVNYYKAKGDSLKVKAAQFIAENIEHHFSYDTAFLSCYRDVLYDQDSLRRNGFDFLVLRSKWDSILREYPLNRCVYTNKFPDAQQVDVDFMIRSIDDAFERWEGNQFRDSINFSNFCNYVLPYKVGQGMVVEVWKQQFVREQELMRSMDSQLSSQVVVDSILKLSKHFKRGLSELDNFPYLTLSDIVLSQQGSCEMGCVYNSMLFSALGFNVAIDMIPAWGNRGSAHMWNCLLTDDDEYAFDPFYESDRWKYKKLYDNVSNHTDWGKFRLPKVFRSTYEACFNELLLNENIENIPHFFRNLLQTDVSSRYFTTSDVQVDVPGDVAENGSYVWLCVFNNQRLDAVQWAKVENGEAVFKDMGRDIVYFTAICRNGDMVGFGDALLLRSDGSLSRMKPSDELEQVLLLRKYAHLNFNPQKIAQSLSNIHFTDSSRGGELSFVRENVEPCRISYLFNEPIDGRYIHIVIPYYEDIKDYRAIAEIEFYDELGKAVKCKMENRFTPLCDGDELTYYNVSRSEFSRKELVIIADKGDDCIQNIKRIQITPRNDRNYIYPDLRYELLYWNSGWQSLGIKEPSVYYSVQYDNVPRNSILWLKCLSEGREERIFIYENGEQKWW